MKKIFLFFSVVMISVSVNAQDEKVEIVPDSLYNADNRLIVQEGQRLSCGVYGIYVEQTPFGSDLPFKVYHLSSKKENWFDQQSLYNTIRAKVPGISIRPMNDLTAVPTIRMRGDDNTIIIVDGVRYDAAILNTLNPMDIESVTVAPSSAATNYFRTN